ncbi:MAG TPA: M3 family metallopeptidase [Candidatus Eremiobacteraceae bacterium]|nr:M3 family metallopeptidase [Candidatus Eremiobacteraceae bacterium]
MTTPRIPTALCAAALSCVIALACARAASAAAMYEMYLPANTGLQWHQTAAQVAQTCDDGIASAKATIAKIESLSSPEWTFDDSLLQIETAEAELNDQTAAQSFLSAVAPTKDVRDAASDCQQKLSDYYNALSADPKIYAIAARVQALGDAKTDAAKKLVESYVLTGIRAGVALPPAERDRVTKLFDTLTGETIAFQRAIDEDKSAVEISQADASSLPPAFVATLSKTSTGYRVPVNESTFSQFMDNESDGNARKAYYLAYERRGGTTNVQRLERAVALRYQLARALGFAQWSDYQLAAKMAKSPTRVMAFLNQIDTTLLPKARAERATLVALKKASGDPTPFAGWDGAYYETKLVKTRYAVDDQVVRQYFPVDHVIAGVFSIYQKLLGVRFTPIAAPDAWAPGVREYAINDAASGKAIGWFYLDLFPRDGKYGHFANFGIRPGRVLPDGSYQKPVTAIVGNWPAPAPGQPALLSHDDVVTFFHEFGHAMHSTLSTAPYETLYGTNVRGDFVEAPSQMLENWMWQPSILKIVSSNVTTGKPLPDALITKMVALQHVGDGADYTGQAFYAAYDMTLHSSGPTVDANALWAKLVKQMTVGHMIPGTYPEASFTHLMSGYDAGYYGYLWSRVFAQDMFTVFQRYGLESPVAGMRYRKDILQPGAVYEPDVLLEHFLGRPVSYDAFYRYLGIAPPR